MLVRESYKSSIDTTIRVVYWDEYKGGNEYKGGHESGYFIIYGTRPGSYAPYRVRCSNIKQVFRFVETVISSDSQVSIELHQFDALNDDSNDQFNIDWENTPENRTTELVAFDFLEKTEFYKRCIYSCLESIANGVIV
jgi:hypothetical protein